MSVEMALWRISSDKPIRLTTTKLDLEARLETWIAEDVSLLGLDVLIVGKQVATAYGGRIDLLAMDREGNLVVIELKRDRTPREVVAQVLDYASWVKDLSPREIYDIASECLGRDLDAVFAERFMVALPESINAAHSMVVVASELDTSSERIIQYLVSQYGVDINAIFFSFFSHDGNEFLGRSWLVDPTTVKDTTERRKAPWSGYWYVNVGDGQFRSWEDCRTYGFLSAGGGKLYSDALKRLGSGDRIFAYQAGAGYVGFGRVTTESPAIVTDFVVERFNTPLVDLDLKQANLSHDSADQDFAEWVVGVEWAKTVPLDQAKRFHGMFANQNIVCKLRDERTFEFLKREFEVAANGPSIRSTSQRLVGAEETP